MKGALKKRQRRKSVIYSERGFELILVSLFYTKASCAPVVIYNQITPKVLPKHRFN